MKSATTVSCNGRRILLSRTAIARASWAYFSFRNTKASGKPSLIMQSAKRPLWRKNFGAALSKCEPHWCSLGATVYLWSCHRYLFSLLSVLSLSHFVVGMFGYCPVFADIVYICINNREICGSRFSLVEHTSSSFRLKVYGPEVDVWSGQFITCT